MGRICCHREGMEELPGTWQQMDRFAHAGAMEGGSLYILPNADGQKGFTAIGASKLMPVLLGRDPGCGLRALRLPEHAFDGAALDRAVRERVRTGFEGQLVTHGPGAALLSRLRYREHSALRYTEDIGVLGAGAHFLEVDRDPKGRYWLLVHAGAPRAGCAFRAGYGERAIRHLICHHNRMARCRTEEEGLAHLPDADARDCFQDFQVLKAYGAMNREVIAGHICDAMEWEPLETLDLPHHGLQVGEDGRFQVRNAALDASKGMPVLIPLTMADGCLYGMGKGNPEWGRSAPAGCARSCGRDMAWYLSEKEYRERMAGVYTTSTCTYTLDESPMAYERPERVAARIGETAGGVEHWRPVYNFKVRSFWRR